MRVLIFGATGMVGQGVLRECLRDTGVELVQTVGRSPTGRKDAKLREVVHADLQKPGAIAGQLRGFEACFFCLGVTSSGMSELGYRSVTYGITLAVAEELARGNPGMTFVYVSGAGTDSSEEGRSMWARVKGATENALALALCGGVHVSAGNHRAIAWDQVENEAVSVFLYGGWAVTTSAAQGLSGSGADDRADWFSDAVGGAAGISQKGAGNG